MNAIEGVEPRKVTVDQFMISIIVISEQAACPIPIRW